MRKIHYAGALSRRGMRIFSGWAACCTGPRAEKIRASGANTLDVSLVTCKSCLRTMSAYWATGKQTEVPVR